MQIPLILTVGTSSGAQFVALQYNECHYYSNI